MTDPRRAVRLLHRAILVLASACLALVGSSAAAQDSDDAPPPRVGRVAIAQGELYVAPQDRAAEWEQVQLNHPIAGGDNVWMSGDGRAEVDYGGGQFRLGPDTSVQVARLDDTAVALFVAQGRVIVRVRALDPGESARVDTPDAQIQLDRPGLYRIDVSPQTRLTRVMVREGQASVLSPGRVQGVVAGQTASITGGGAIAEVVNGVGLDALDTWSAERDRVYERGRVSTAYVSRQMVGYADLESHGTWQSYPEYGAVWFPAAVVADWAPYRYGRWVWLSAYGWTWVDDAPWGYAPFHYGRWAYIGGRWGWCPGTFVARPVWAPALVAWYGGSGWSYSSSYGAPVFGWVPLGWRDPFVPWWGRCSNRCYTRYNRPYAVDVTVRPRHPGGTYANARVPGAATAVPADALRDTRPVQATRIALPPQGLASAPVLAAAPAVRPAAVANRPLQPGRVAPQPAGDLAARVSRPPERVVAPVERPIRTVPPMTSPERGVRAVPPAATPPVAVERSVRAVPPGAIAPPPQQPMRVAPQAPVTAVPPAVAPPRAVAPPPQPQQQQPQPQNREAPSQRPGQPNGPRQQQN